MSDSDSDKCEFLVVAREAVDQLKKLTKDFPHLSSVPVRDAIENWNEDLFRRGELIWEEQQRIKAEKSAVELRAIELIEECHVDDVIDMLSSEFAQEFDYHDLIDRVGKNRYIAALRREAVELQINCVTPEQTAELWNSCGKPPVGGERWNEVGVSVLMG
ncbi:MAG: hypothetical protein P8179_13380 [Candidatus Thiodiazotropha sp.]|jgi:hypothetical protein